MPTKREWERIMRKIKSPADRVCEAIDRLADALTGDRHDWNVEQRKAYNAAIRSARKHAVREVAP